MILASNLLGFSSYLCFYSQFPPIHKVRGSTITIQIANSVWQVHPSNRFDRSILVENDLILISPFAVRVELEDELMLSFTLAICDFTSPLIEPFWYVLISIDPDLNRSDSIYEKLNWFNELSCRYVYCLLRFLSCWSNYELHKEEVEVVWLCFFYATKMELKNKTCLPCRCHTLSNRPRERGWTSRATRHRREHNNRPPLPTHGLVNKRVNRLISTAQCF